MNKPMLMFSLICLMIGSIGFGQGEYAQYETENLELYRVAYSFEYPDFPKKEGNTQPVISDWADPLNENGPAKGEVEYKMEPGINRLMSLHLIEFDEDNMTEGYRVQLFAGSNLGTANKIKSDFKMEYDEEEVYLDWEQPTFRVRAGDFITRNEAMIFCNELKPQFPGAFVVKDKVEKPQLRKPKFDPDAVIPNDTPDDSRFPDDNR